MEAFRELAKVILGYTKAEIERLVENRALFNVEKPEDDDNA